MRPRSPAAMAAAVLLLFAIVFLPGCSSDDCVTCPQVPGTAALSSTILVPQPFPSYYAGTWAAGTNDLFVAAGGGVVLRRHAGAWITYNTGVVANLYGIWGTSSGNVYACGEGGTLVHFDGSAWHRVDSGVFDVLGTIHGTGPGDIYAGGNNGVLIHYDGTAWTRVDVGPYGSERSLSDIWCAPTGEVFVAVERWEPNYDGTVLMFDGVSTWTEQTFGAGYLHTIWGTARDNVWTGGDNGAIYRWNGSVWTLFDTIGGWVNSIRGTGPADVWAACSDWVSGTGSFGVMARFDGSAWQPAGLQVNPPVYNSVSPVSSNEAYATAASSMVLEWDGIGWSLANDAWLTSNHLGVIWGSSASDFWTLDDMGGAYRYDGTHWETGYSGSEEYKYAAWGSGPNNIYAVGAQGSIVHYDGGSWTAVAHGLGSAELYDIWGTAADNIWVACNIDGVLWHYNGSGWFRIAAWPPEYGYATSVWGGADDDFYAVTYNLSTGNGGVMHYDGAAWSPRGLGGYTPQTVHGVSATEVYFTTIGWDDRIRVEGKAAVAAQPPPGDAALVRYNGTTGALTAEYTNFNMQALWALGHNNVFIVGSRGLSVVVGHYDGSQIVTHEPDAHTWVGDIWGTGNGTLFMCGGGGTVIRVDKH